MATQSFFCPPAWECEFPGISRKNRAIQIARKSTKNKVLVPQLYLRCSKYLGFNSS